MDMTHFLYHNSFLHKIMDVILIFPFDHVVISRSDLVMSDTYQ